MAFDCLKVAKQAMTLPIDCFPPYFVVLLSVWKVNPRRIHAVFGIRSKDQFIIVIKNNSLFLQQQNSRHTSPLNTQTANSNDELEEAKIDVVYSVWHVPPNPFLPT